MKNLFLACLLMGLAKACIPENPSQREARVAPTAADLPYAGVFEPLDGVWRGVFRIFEDTARLERQAIDLRNIDRETLSSRATLLRDSLLVLQHYVSESPYFQRVIIQDSFPTTGKSINSQGYNKVEDGALLCVVRKPDETVVHQGILEEPHTIVWRRKLDAPFKEEYFRETVRGDVYEIVGWGYYGDVDTTLSPPLWFHGRYERRKRAD